MLSWRLAKRLVIFVIGMTVVLAGIAMIVLPGPAIVVIPLGLAILGTEFVWAQRLLKRVKERVKAFPAIIGSSQPKDAESADVGHQVDLAAGSHSGEKDTPAQDLIHEPPPRRPHEV